MFDVGSSSGNPRAWFNEKEITHIDDLHPGNGGNLQKIDIERSTPSDIGSICERYRVETTGKF